MSKLVHFITKNGSVVHFTTKTKRVPKQTRGSEDSWTLQQQQHALKHHR